MSDDLSARFEQAAQDAQNLPSRPDNDTMLKIYALYKQGTKGDVSGKRPGFVNPVGRAKYDAWAGLSGTSKTQAMTDYVELIDQLKG